ncbi:MAG: ferredoxin--NADP reductase [Bacteroidota bacterium]|nr:ferredoxin--NADP reductase [Bacteroidota bacterium]
MKSYSLTVKEIARETPQSIKITFDNAIERIAYESGQFITFVLQLDGKEVRRSYSICSSPYVDALISVAVKEVENGFVSKYLNNQLKVGDKIEVIEPMGHFVCVPSSKKRHIVLIGAGSGITPLMSMLTSILMKEPQSIVTLLYGNRTEDSIIFNHTLIKYSNEYPSRFNYIPVISKPNGNWTKETGRIRTELVQKYVLAQNNSEYQSVEYFICGPKIMMDDLTQYLISKGVQKDFIHKESFHNENTGAPAEAKGFTKSKVTVKDGSKTYQFEVETKNTILETGLKLGYKLPYSCQSGMCTACMGKCTFGKVIMDNPDGLTDGEIAKGYVLTCCGHPATEEVVIEL